MTETRNPRLEEALRTLASSAKTATPQMTVKIKGDGNVVAAGDATVRQSYQRAPSRRR